MGLYHIHINLLKVLNFILKFGQKIIATTTPDKIVREITSKEMFAFNTWVLMYGHSALLNQSKTDHVTIARELTVTSL
jgi:hypothetical protein